MATDAAELKRELLENGGDPDAPEGRNQVKVGLAAVAALLVEEELRQIAVRRTDARGLEMVRVTSEFLQTR
jgi:hypothetical protein